MEEPGFQVKGFEFRSTESGGLEIVVRAGENHHSPVVRSLHLSEEELFEMLAFLGLSADGVDEEEVVLYDREGEGL